MKVFLHFYFKIKFTINCLKKSTIVLICCGPNLKYIYGKYSEVVNAILLLWNSRLGISDNSFNQTDWFCAKNGEFCQTICKNKIEKKNMTQLFLWFRVGREKGNTTKICLGLTLLCLCDNFDFVNFKTAYIFINWCLGLFSFPGFWYEI